MPTPGEIIAARMRAGLSVAAAAALKRWTRGHWANLESGERTISDLDWAHWLHLAGLEQLPFQPAKKRDAPAAGA
ncbi:MAG: hypothetical protein JWN13_5406 [Betaproteobacteria bacterium]|nr:hypothetical protein [Betaproteobacteria bacterium]